MTESRWSFQKSAEDILFPWFFTRYLRGFFVGGYCGFSYITRKTRDTQNKREKAYQTTLEQKAP